jgi:hypothetical protein
MRQLLRRPVTRVGLAVVLVGLVAGLLWFEPWRAFTSSHLDEPAPASAETLAEGAFVSQEHETTGTARVLELPDGSRVLRLADFSTSDGPDVRVRLSYADDRYALLGELKATDGNHNYAIPAGLDLTGLTSAVIWCDRFDVPFGSAAIDP